MVFTKIQVCIYDQKEFNLCKDYYKDHHVLEIIYGNIFNEVMDCMITAGNSFGLMDGGIDGSTNYFFNMIEKRVQDKILKEWRGELPVGASLIFETPENKNFKFLCYTPTMRVPSNVAKTQNTYYSMRGALIECEKYDIKTITVPLLCRGVGCMHPEKILHQIKHAYETFINPTKRDWKDISYDQGVLFSV